MGLDKQFVVNFMGSEIYWIEVNIHRFSSENRVLKHVSNSHIFISIFLEEMISEFAHKLGTKHDVIEEY